MLKHATRPTFKSSAHELISVSMDTDREQVLSWISILDHAASLKSKVDARLPETAKQITEERNVVKWLAEEEGSQILWLHNLPGTGVSTLAATIIEHIQRNVVRERDAVAFTFASSKLETNALDILSCICRQLASQCSKLPWQLIKLYTQKAKVDDRLDIDEIMLLIVGMCKHFSRVFVIIDGIHEVLEERGLNVLLAKIEWMRNNGANVLVSSSSYCDRPERPGRYRKIEEAFDHKIVCQKPYRTDSETVLRHRLRGHATGRATLVKHGLSEEEFIMRIDKECGRIFQVAELRLEQKLRLLGKSDIGPGNLFELSLLEAAIYYDRPSSIMQRLPDWQGYIVKEILTWVIFAVTPFNLEQIAFIIFRLVHRSQPQPELYSFETLERDVMIIKYSAEGLLLTMFSVIDICEGLIRVTDGGHVVLSNEGSCKWLQKAAAFEGSQFHITVLSLSLMTVEQVVQSDHEPLWNPNQIAPIISYCQNHWAHHLLECTRFEQRHIIPGAVTYFRMIYQRPKR